MSSLQGRIKKLEQAPDHAGDWTNAPPIPQHVLDALDVPAVEIPYPPEWEALQKSLRNWHVQVFRHGA